MLFFVPVKKLSAQITWCPCATSRSHRWLPRKPAPPVTRTWLLPLYLRMLSCLLDEEFSLGIAVRASIDLYRCVEAARGVGTLPFSNFFLLGKVECSAEGRAPAAFFSLS